MRLPRLTIRHLMLAVAVVAAAIGGDLMLKRRAAEFARRAQGFRDRAEFHLLSHKISQGCLIFVPDEPEDVPPETPGRAAVVLDLTLARKYERAARSPWLPVEPDPPGVVVPSPAEAIRWDSAP